MEYLKQVCTLIRQDDYLTSIDLTDAFLHVLVHQSSRRFLQFAWNGRLFQLRVLLFGMSLSPMVFTKSFAPFFGGARRKGTRVAAYLDDLLIVAKDGVTSSRHNRMVLDKLSELGFLVKQEKSSIDSKTLTLTVLKTKVSDLRREASRLLLNRTSSIRLSHCSLAKHSL